jgi:hypothetical protein
MLDRDPAGHLATVGKRIEYVAAVSPAQLVEVHRNLNSSGVASRAPATPARLADTKEEAKVRAFVQTAIPARAKDKKIPATIAPLAVH